jgi:VanZ family protein
MGKRHVYVIPVPKGATVAMLVLTTIAMMALVWFLSGKAYVGDAHPVRDLLKRLLGSGPRSVSPDAVLASLTPAIANFLLFVPWGFFAFLAADTDSRPRVRTYALTLAAAVVFTMAMYFWQGHLPTRVTALPDTVSHTLGALAGAALGHARKTVRVRFDF